MLSSRAAALALALAATGGLSGCSAVGTEPAEASTARPCLAVTDELLSQIAVGTEPGSAFDVVEGSAVRARKGVYVVAVRFQGETDEPQVGIWTVTALEGPAAPVLVADEVSSAYSSWNTVEEFPQFGVPLDSPHLDNARRCLEG